MYPTREFLGKIPQIVYAANDVVAAIAVTQLQVCCAVHQNIMHSIHHPLAIFMHHYSQVTQNVHSLLHLYDILYNCSKSIVISLMVNTHPCIHASTEHTYLFQGQVHIILLLYLDISQLA